MKYYSTVLSGYIIPEEIREKYDLGNPGRHQYRFVVKAKSFASANQIAFEVLGRKKVFSKDYTSETGNNMAIDKCDQYGAIIGSLHFNNYHDANHVVMEIKNHRNDS